MSAAPMPVSSGSVDFHASAVGASFPLMDTTSMYPPRIEGLAYLYRYFDAIGRLLYVGVTRTPQNRASAHRSWSPWIGEAVRIEYERYPEWFAYAQEKLAVELDAPKYNVVGAPIETQRRLRGKRRGLRHD